MAQFDVYLNKGADRKQYPYMLDIQCNIIASATSVVVPLILLEFAKERGMDTIEDINPVLLFGNQEVILAMHLLSGVSKKELTEKVGSMFHFRDEIVRAFDVIISGI